MQGKRTKIYFFVLQRQIHNAHVHFVLKISLITVAQFLKILDEDRYNLFSFEMFGIFFLENHVAT